MDQSQTLPNQNSPATPQPQTQPAPSQITPQTPPPTPTEVSQVQIDPNQTEPPITSPQQPPYLHPSPSPQTQPPSHLQPPSTDQPLPQNPHPPMTQQTQNDPISRLSNQYNVNTQKPFFPVNTMRLLYLLITDGLTGSNPNALNEVNAMIPKISSVFDARDQFLADNQETNPLLEIESCRSAINDIFKVTNTPIIHHTFDLLFSDLYPLQENLLFSLDQHLKEKQLEIADLLSILKIRAMDSVVYSTIIHQIILNYQHADKDFKDIYQAANYSTSPVHWQINTTLQINDLCDAVIHAQEDIKTGSATIIDIIQKITSDPSEVEEIINHILDNLIKQSQKLPFPQPLQGHIKAFNDQLTQTIK